MKRGWFGPKMIGWGVSPKSWEGWLVTVVVIGAFSASVRWFGPVLHDTTGLPVPLITLGLALVTFGVMSGIVTLTYDGRGE